MEYVIDHDQLEFSHFMSFSCPSKALETEASFFLGVKAAKESLIRYQAFS